MKEIISVISILLMHFYTNAQFNLQYTNTRQAAASHNMTILDQAADASGNIYIVYSDDPSKILILSKVNVNGSTLWTDTVSVPGFPQVNVITAKVNIGQNKVYVLFPGYGVPSPAGAIIAIYDLNGNYLNGFNASSLNNVWSYGVYGIHEKSNGNILAYYSYGDQFTTNDTMYVKEFSANFSTVWELKYPVSKLTWYCPTLLEANGNYYFTYTNDSIVAGSHYLKSYTRKVDNNGTVMWTNMIENVANRCMKKLPNGDIIIAGNNNPAGSILGNNTGDAKTTRLNDANGDTLWTRSYNGINNEREDVNGLEVDQLNNIYVVGTEDIHDYTPMVNKGYLQKYNSAGQLQFDHKIPSTSSTMGVYLDALSNLNTLSILGSGTIHLKKVLATNGTTIDSLSTTAGYAMGKSATTNNAGDDVFFTYSEGHCGANHLEVLRFCTKAICNNPDEVGDLIDLKAIQVYPNPATEQLLIEIPAIVDSKKNLNVRVFDMLGQLKIVKSFNTTNSASILSIELSTLSSGMYVVQCELDNQLFAFKFVKE
ncbi:MAG: T9SS type A sorting domain-containing protein [Bacteroidetes bacterium]|nr:T9SS type A sorting domain-containing protein [Bacteroidota bacterium]